MNLDFNKLSPLSFMTLVMVFFVTVSPGALFLFIYTRDVFFEIDSFKLVLLSFGITSPFWILNTLPYMFWDGAVVGDNKVSSPFIACLAGSFWTIPVVYFPILSHLFWDLSFKRICIMMIAIELVLFIIMLLTETVIKPSKK